MKVRTKSMEGCFCMLSRVNILLNHPVVVIILVYYNMVPVNTQYQITLYT